LSADQGKQTAGPGGGYISILELEAAAMQTKGTIWASLLCVLILLLSALACQEDQHAHETRVVKVGALFPLSGDLKDKGVDSANGVRLAVEEINSSGGIASMDGAKLEVVYVDTKGKPSHGASEVERLISKEGVAAIIGTYQSSVTKQATQVAERLETPFIVSVSIADIITERGFRYTFRIQPKATFYARDQVQFLRDLKKLAGYSVQRVALLHENTDFGTSAALAQKRDLRKYGMQVVADVSYKAEGVANLDQEVAQVLAAKPDAILTVTYLMDSVLIRKALAKAGAAAPMVDTAGGTVSPEYIGLLGPLANGAFTVAEFSKFAAGGKKLNERFKRHFKVDITGDSAHAYQAVLVLKEALERTGSRDKAKLRDALASTDIGKGDKLVLPSERLRFDKSGQNEFARLFVMQIQNGELVPVWPAQYATGKVKINK
jgi:branched-chain amino acid transport system substrate-binding protein